MKRFVISIIGLVMFCSSATAQLTDKQQIAKLNSVFEHIRDNYVDDVSLAPLVERAIIASLKELDPHSKYLTKEEMESAKSHLRGVYAGIGINYLIHNDTVVVRRVLENSPAMDAGIELNDRITAINNKSIIGLPTDSISALLKGDVGSKVAMKVERRGYCQPIDVECKRRIINTNVISAAFRIGDVGYISIDSFSRRTAGEFYAAYLSLGDTKSIVIDLRDNSGGLISAAIDLTSLFLNKGDIIVSTEGREESNTYSKRRDTKPIDIPLVVLINENSASASEIFAGAIQDHDRGIIVGHTSFGKGLVQRIYNLKDGSGIYLTIAHYKTPSGRIIQRPYAMGKGEEYIADSLRFTHPDSISYQDRPIYKTLKLGRDVYGGGGITPDKYIDISKHKLSRSVIEAINNRANEHALIDYIDSVSLESIAQLYPTMGAFNTEYNLDSKLLDKFFMHAQLSSNALTEVDIEYIRTLLMSGIAGQLYGMNAYYYIYVSRFDPMARRAIMVATDEIVR